VYFFYLDGVEQDHSLARTYLQLAAEQGHPEGLRMLGDISYPEDINSSLNYYRLSADKGNDNALIRMVDCYRLGIWNFWSDKPNPFEAVKYWQKAADLGHTEAQLIMGQYYESGNFVPKDLSKAIKYFILAAEQGEESVLNDILSFCSFI